MKVARYDLFVEALASDAAALRGTSRVELYRPVAGIWWDQQGQKVTVPALLETLVRTRDTQEVGRGRRGNTMFYPVAALDAVLEVAFATTPRPDAIERVARRIQVSLVQSQDRYKATHHDLTGLMNREAFNRALVERLERMAADHTASVPDLVGSAVDKIDAVHAIGVIAIDIDHFKQINDTYGHLYGDLVLRALALRLERLLPRRAAELGIELVPAHPSGEEFLILMRGSFTDEQEREVAEAVRAEIGGAILPTEEEWAELTRGEAGEGASLPNPAFRRVTISLGIASVRGTIERDAARQLGFTLKNRADIALYKAKTSGRNQCVKFTDIVRSFGRILEHHPETNIVAIDLGRAVNVTIGQEFLVYHPTFVGGQPFMFDDGRTRKRLGDYPRVSSGRIEVFQVQPEIAFCTVSDNRTRGAFPAGSLLEAVPVGSIAHLIPDESHVRVAVLGRSDLDDRVREILRRDSMPYAVVFAITNSEQIIDSKGPAALNRILAELYSAIRKCMPRSPAVGQLLPTQLACIGFDDNDLDDAEIAAVLRQADDAAGGTAKLVAGVYCELDRAKFAERQDLPQLRATGPDREGALEYARFAALAARQYDKPIVHFDHLTPDVIIYTSRTSTTIEQTEKDFSELERLRAVNARAVNQLALGQFGARNYRRADELYSTIIDLELAAPALRATFLNNAGANKWLLGQTPQALACFHRAMEIEGRVVPDPRYRGYYALVHYEEWKVRGRRDADDGSGLPGLLQQALANEGRDLPKWQVDRLHNAQAELSRAIAAA